MHKVKFSLAALVAGAFLPSLGTKASMDISSFTFYSDVLNPPQLTIDAPPILLRLPDSRISVGELNNLGMSNTTGSPLSSTTMAIDPRKVELSIKPNGHLNAYSDFAVGINSLAMLRRYSDPILHIAPPSSRTAEQWNFIQSLVVGPDFWDAVGNMFDVTEDERPWSDTTSVHVLAPTGNPFIPFATVAYEIDSIEVYDRIGLGGGAQIALDKNITLGADLIYFGDRLDETTSHETHAMARLWKSSFNCSACQHHAALHKNGEASLRLLHLLFSTLKASPGPLPEADVYSESFASSTFRHHRQVCRSICQDHQGRGLRHRTLRHNDVRKTGLRIGRIIRIIRSTGRSAKIGKDQVG